MVKLMSTPLMAVIFVSFVAALSLVVLRFSAVLSLMQRQQSLDRRELLRDIDSSHERAFANAMTALGRIYEKSHVDQMTMFDKTMDMVHGPQDDARRTQAGDMAVDRPEMDIRPAWMPNDDEQDGGLLYSDPTDELLPDEAIWSNGHMMAEDPDSVTGDGSQGFAVTVRPGEGLI